MHYNTVIVGSGAGGLELVSTLGRELGRHAVEDYTETKTLNMHIGARTGWWMPR